MYEWLQHELAEIKTRRFHVTFAEDVPARSSRAIAWPSPAPTSFAKFIRVFGAVKLYRELSYYLIRVFKTPILETNDKGVSFLVFGGYDSGVAGFEPEALAVTNEPPVWETVGASGFQKTADSFDEWMRLRASSARKRYSRREWAAIVQGPAPFTHEELAVVRARRKFEWRLLGVTETGCLRFEVTNNSDRVLPYLSIGLRAPDLVGGIWLPVSAVAPGKTAIVEHEGYRESTDPHRVEAFAKSDPDPEDRERYWEFGEPVA